MDTSLLQEWTTKNEIINRTIEGFWNYFRNWKKECRDEYHNLFLGKIEEEFINLEVRSIKLVYSYMHNEDIFCSLDINFMERFIGSYEMKFNMNGDTTDDYLNLDDDNLIHYLMEERKTIIKIIKKCIREGLDWEFISRITGFDMKYIEIINRKLVK